MAWPMYFLLTENTHELNTKSPGSQDKRTTLHGRKQFRSLVIVLLGYLYMILSSEVSSASPVILPFVVAGSYSVYHQIDSHYRSGVSSVDGISSYSSDMSSMPYAMRMVQSEKKRQSRQDQATGGTDATAGTYSTSFENPTMYSSKMMNSIWGMYNQYSVHNFKSKQCEPSQGTSSSGLGGNSTFSQTNASSSGSEGPYKCSGSGRMSSFDYPSMAAEVAMSLANAMTRFH